MNTSVEKFRETLRTKMTKLEGQLEGIKSDLKTGEQEDKVAIQAKLKAAKLGVQRMAKEVRAAEAKAGKWIKAKEQSGSSIIQGWKSRFEKAKLDHHANKAAHNAVAAVSIAEAKIANAALATYEAIDARMAANDVGEGLSHSGIARVRRNKKSSASKRA